MTKYSIKELEKALEHFKKKGAVAVGITVDDNYRLKLTTSTDVDGNGVVVTVFSTGAEDVPNLMATVTETRRL